MGIIPLRAAYGTEQYSLRTNYIFRESLRGFSLGGGVRWQAGAVLGALATRADANGVLRPIVPLASRPTIRGDAVFLTDLNVGYQRKIMHGRVAWEIQCNVSNILNNRERIPTTIFGDGLVRYYRWNEPRRIAVATAAGSALACARMKSLPPVSPTSRG